MQIIFAQPSSGVAASDIRDTEIVAAKQEGFTPLIQVQTEQGWIFNSAQNLRHVNGTFGFTFKEERLNSILEALSKDYDVQVFNSFFDAAKWLQKDSE